MVPLPFAMMGFSLLFEAPDLELRLPRLASALTQGLELGASLNTSAVLSADRISIH